MMTNTASSKSKLLKPKLRTLCVALCAIMGALPAASQNYSDVIDAEILPGWQRADGTHMAGLQLTLAPGWKTYWRAPGDGGIPPRFNWSGSRNLADVQVQYPTPKVMDQNGIQSIGYDHDVVFPLSVTAKDASQPIQLSGVIEIGVCEEICIPYTLDVTGVLPATGAHDAEIAAGMSDRPADGGQFACRIEPISDGLRVVAQARVARMSGEAAVVEGGIYGTWVSQAVLKRKGETLSAMVEMVPPTAQPFALARNEVRLTVIGREGAVEFIGCQ